MFPDFVLFYFALIFSLSITGAILNTSSLFTYDSEHLLNTYLRAPKHDPDFNPAFSAPEDPGDALLVQASKLCSGEGSTYCRYH